MVKIIKYLKAHSLEDTNKRLLFSMCSWSHICPPHVGGTIFPRVEGTKCPYCQLTQSQENKLVMWLSPYICFFP